LARLAQQRLPSLLGIFEFPSRSGVDQPGRFQTLPADGDGFGTLPLNRPDVARHARHEHVERLRELVGGLRPDQVRLRLGKVFPGVLDRLELVHEPVIKRLVGISG